MAPLNLNQANLNPPTQDEPSWFARAFSGFTVLSANEKNTEELRLLDPGPAHDYLNSLFEKLKPELIKRCGAEFVNSIEIHVTDHPWLTCHANQGNKTLIVIDTTLLSNIKSEDALVSILGHEIGHGVYRLENNIPHDYRATIEEECFCDLFGMQMAQNLGLNPRGVEELFIFLSEERQKNLREGSNDFLMDLLNRSGDEHLTPEARVKNIQTAIGAIRLSTGDELLGANTQIKPLGYDNENFVHSDKAKHISHIDTWKIDNKYDEKSLIEKIKLLNELSSDLSNKARQHEYYQLAEKLCTIDEKPKSPAELKILMREFDLLFETVVDLPIKNKKLRPFLYAKSLSSFWQIDAHLLSSVRRLQQGIKAVNNSLNHKELVECSQKLLDLIGKNHELYQIAQGSLAKVLPVYYDPYSAHNEKTVETINNKIIKKAILDKSLAIAKLLLINDGKSDYPITIKWDKFLDRFTLDQAREIYKSNIPFYTSDFSKKFLYYLDLRERNESLMIDPEKFWQNPNQFIQRYSDLLISPYSRKNDTEISQSPYYGLSNDEAQDKHLKFSNNLKSILQEAVDSNNQERIQIINELFIGTFIDDGKKFINGLIPQILKEPSSYNGRYPHTGVWADFVYQNRDIFPLDKRIQIIRDLQVALPEDPSWLFSYLDTKEPKNLDQLSTLLDDTKYLSLYTDSQHEQYNKFLILQLSRILESDINSEEKIFELIKFHSSKYHIWPGSKESKDYRTNIRNKISNINYSMEKLADRIDTLEGKIDFLFECDSQSLLTGVDERDRILESIVKEIKSLDDPQVIEDLTIKILRNRSCLGSPDIKNTLIDLWVEIAYEKYGIDPNYKTNFIQIGSNVYIQEDLPTHEIREQPEYSWQPSEYIGHEYSYYDAIVNHLNASLQGVSSGLKVEALSKLADKIQAQPPLCYKLEQIAKSEFSNQYGNSDKKVGVHIGTKGAEAFLEYASNDSKRKEDLIGFLCEPLNDINTKRFVDKVKTWDNSYDKYSNVIGHYSTDQERDLKYEMSAHDFHRNFWRLSPEGRILAMDQILVPAKDIVLDPETTLSGALSLVLDRLFPTDKTEDISDKEIKERYWARTFVDLYVKSSHQTEWPLLLACLLTASENLDSSNKATNTGKRLKAIFEALGPAYIKLGQAIHSYPGTPEDIKNELASLKNSAAPLIRWDLFRRIEGAVPKSYLEQIDRYGHVLGSASFNIITEVTLNDGQKRALAVLRENSLPLATKGFNHMKHVVNKLAEQEHQFSEHKQDALNIIQQAIQMTAIETDMDQGFKQSSLAKSQYDSRIITAAGRKFTFKVCTWGEYGKEWRDMELGSGVDIKDSAARQAILIAEMIQMLSGEEFDCDRHENQYKISGNTIYVFDHGGMSLNKPTTEEKQQIGLIISSIANKIIEKKSPKTAIAETLKDIEVSSDYIERIKKGLLALSFTFENIKPKEGLAVIMTVFGSKSLDPLIKQTLINNLHTAKHNKLALKFANIISAGIPGYGARSSIKVPFLEDVYI